MGRHIVSALAVWLASTAALASQVAAPTPAEAAPAGNDTVRRGEAPAWVKLSKPMAVPADAQGLVFVRRSDNLVRLDEDGQQTYVGQHIKILHPQALQLGNVGVVWNPATGAPTVHTLRIHRDGAVMDLLDTAEFEVLRREGQLEEAMLDGTLTAIHRVPDLRVGDEIEFAYSGPTQDPTLGNRSFGLMVLADDLQAGRYRLGMQWTQGQKPNLKLTPDFQEVAVLGKNGLVLDFDNPATTTPPKDAPPRFSWMRIVEFSDFAEWQDVSRQFAPLYSDAAALKPGSPLVLEVERIRTAHSTDLARAAAALELVQAQVRYIYVGLDGGNYTPASAEDTWQRRYGDCKGKTVLLLAMLRELGITAQPVLVSNSGLDDGLDQRLPGPALFDHVLVRARIDGVPFWLDGTLPPVVGPGQDPIVDYRFVLPLIASGSDIVNLPEKPFAMAQTMGLYEIDASAGFDQPARMTTTTVTRGLAGLAEYVALSTKTNSQLTEAYRSALVGGDEWDTISSVSHRYDQDTQANFVTIEGVGPVDWTGDEGERRRLSLPGGGFYTPSRMQRAADQDQAAPFYSEPSYTCYVTTLRLPEGTDLQNWGFNTTFDKQIFGRVFFRMIERRDDRTIRMVRGSRTQQSEISPIMAQRDNGRLADFDNSQASVTYDPDEVMEGWGNLHPVPAIDEIDWTRPDAPCLPADMLKR